MNRKRVLLFSLALTLLMAACGSPTAEPSSPPATATASGPALLDFPRGVCCDGTALEPGAYQLPRWFSPTISVETPDDGWRVVRENSIETIYLVRGETPDAEAIQLFALFALDPDQPVDEFQVSVMDSPDITLLGDPSPTTVAGFNAWVVDAQAKPNPDEEGNPDADIRPGTQRIAVIEEYFTTTFYFWYTFTPEARIRVYTFNNGHQDLVIYIEAPAADFDAFAAKAEAVLETLTVEE